MNYLLLVLGVTCFVIALWCFSAVMASVFLGEESEDEDEKRIYSRVVTWAGAGAIVAAFLAREIYGYLAFADPDLLKDFSQWYMLGYVSRFLILVRRHEVLSSRSSTDWDKVFQMFLWAALGPFVTLHLIRVTFTKRDRCL